MTDTRDYILQTAFSLFLTKSYKAVTMKDLESATGLTKGAFYHYFKSKEEIYIEVIDKYYLAYDYKNTASLQDVTLKEYIELQLSNLSLLMNRLKDIAKVDCPDPNTLSLIIEAKKYYPGFIEKLKERDNYIFNSWTRIISEAKAKGEIRHDIETDILAENFIAVEYSIFRYITRSRSFEFALSMIKLQYNQLYRLVKE